MRVEASRVAKLNMHVMFVATERDAITIDILHFWKHEDKGTKWRKQITSPQGSSIIALECDEDVYIFIRIFLFGREMIIQQQ